MSDDNRSISETFDLKDKNVVITGASSGAKTLPPQDCQGVISNHLLDHRRRASSTVGVQRASVWYSGVLLVLVRGWRRWYNGDI